MRDKVFIGNKYTSVDVQTQRPIYFIYYTYSFHIDYKYLHIGERTNEQRAPAANCTTTPSRGGDK